MVRQGSRCTRDAQVVHKLSFAHRQVVLVAVGDPVEVQTGDDEPGQTRRGQAQRVRSVRLAAAALRVRHRRSVWRLAASAPTAGTRSKVAVRPSHPPALEDGAQLRRTGPMAVPLCWTCQMDASASRMSWLSVHPGPIGSVMSIVLSMTLSFVSSCWGRVGCSFARRAGIGVPVVASGSAVVGGFVMGVVTAAGAGTSELSSC